MSVRVEFKRGSSQITSAQGTRVFMEDGTEITGIVSIGMPEFKVDNILCITLTIPVSDIKFVD